jgi:hypothetical protein
MASLTLQEIENRLIQRMDLLMQNATAESSPLLIEFCGDVFGLVDHTRSLDRRVARLETQMMSLANRVSQG